ncbi:major facilitator superfamily domain-containing protein [Aspergillus avenaceus]|uniref:Major facilitator superfamily domain-containing protein n=1 Tax=Aspergillus avenaceus TaxID=36643 RepID=A0A5N6TWT5_ASPAV|nr:major facilitator superfamily domain-containing protein [Aspergillus avenaceus]
MSRAKSILGIGITIVAVDFGSALTLAPQIALFESLICRRLGGGGDCKSPEVQGELALLIGWKETLDQLPGIIVALPYGLAADRFGRKPILLGLFGLVLEEIAIRLVCWWNVVIPLRIVCATSIFQIIGGGAQTASAMAYAMITDVVPAEKRASTFYITAAVVLLGEILATPLNAFLMISTPGMPTLLGVEVELAGLSAATFVSETRPGKPPTAVQTTTIHERREELRSVGDGDDSTDYEHRSWKHTMSGYWMHLRGAGENSWDLNMVTFLALQLIIPYASSRFMWSIPRASFLVTLKGIINLIILLLILPWLSARLSRWMSWSPAVKDLRVVQGSAWFLTFGALLMALAAQPGAFVVGVCVFAFGWGFSAALRSLATALALPSQVGLLNSRIGLAQGIGSPIAGPIPQFRHSTNITKESGYSLDLNSLQAVWWFSFACCSEPFPYS